MKSPNESGPAPGEPGDRDDADADAEAGAQPLAEGSTRRGTEPTAPRAAVADPDAGTSAPSLPFLTDAEAPDTWIGRTIDARYKVITRIGRGGMGSVYKVEHLHMGKVAAMKVLHRELAADRDVVKRFKREAEAVSRLTHVNTVQTFDFGSFDGALYLVMEYVKGEDLGAIVKRDGPLPFARVGPIFAQICAALSEAHEAGIIHRDLKPENVLVTRARDGRDVVKVVDFGLAKVREREEANEVTGRGNLVGTPYYMSPEQIRSDGVDARSDVYSLGAMLYRVLTGEPPFAGATPMAVLTKHLTDELVPPRERVPALAAAIDERVEAIVMRAMAKKPDERFPSVEVMRVELEAVLATPAQPSGEGDGDADGVPRLARGSLELARGSLPMRRASDHISDHGSGQGSGSGRHERSPRAYEATAPREKLDPDELHGADAGANDSDSAQGVKLRREDLDDYEKSLRRRGWARTVLVPVVVLALAGGAALTLRWWQRRPRTVEVEPNNDAEHATKIAAGRAITGKLKGRLDDSNGDRDFFELMPAGTPGARVLTARLDAIPNIDLELDVIDASGRALARADATAVGGAEVLPDVRSDGRAVYLVVREVPVAGKWPTENTSDGYRLLVTAQPLTLDMAAEPSDDASPTELAAGRTMTGYLGQPEDRDVFTLTTGGSGSIEVSGIDGVDITLEVNGKKVDAGAYGAPERVDAEWPAGARVVVARKDPPGRPPEREATGARIVGLEVPYRLNVTLK